MFVSFVRLYTCVRVIKMYTSLSCGHRPYGTLLLYSSSLSTSRTEVVVVVIVVSSSNSK